jgi:hypothetical protein
LYCFIFIFADEKSRNMSARPSQEAVHAVDAMTTKTPAEVNK